MPLTRAAPQGPAVWCRKLFKGEECEEVWAWYAGQRASALARRSVNELWHRVGRTGRKRKLFADHEMRRRILAIKKGEYLALNKIKVARIVAGWAGSRGARRGAKARAVPAKPAPAPPCPLGSAPPAAAEVQEEVPVEFRLALFTTFFTAQMGRGKIQWGAFYHSEQTTVQNFEREINHYHSNIEFR
jgi:hypothetical protein